MKLEEKMSKLLYEHPFLFYYSTWKRVRQSLLNQLFVTLGNGFGWHKEEGVLCEGDEAEFVEYDGCWIHSGKLTEDVPKYINILNEENYKEILDTLPLQEPRDFEFDLWERFGKGAGESKPVAKQMFAHMYEDSDKGWTPYGILSSGHIRNLPDNIEDTWLAGAKEITSYLREFYEAGFDDRRTIIDYKYDNDLEEHLSLCLEAVEKVENRIMEIENDR